MKSKKQEFEDLKKTAAAHGTLSEETAKEISADSEKITEKMIDKANESEEVVKPIIEITEKAEDIVSMTDEERNKRDNLLKWEPKTKLGRDVKDGKIRNIDEILDSHKKILEEQIVDKLLNLKNDLVSIGQAKGKFGGGKRRAWRQTQKKTKEGNVPVFSTMVVVGDENGHVGTGIGRAKETLPARDKAQRAARLNIMKVRRECASFDCNCGEAHTVPFKVTGKCGSVIVTLIPAPQGTGLVAGKELKKLLKLAGIKDVYTQTFGKKRTTFNLIRAGFEALRKANNTSGGTK